MHPSLLRPRWKLHAPSDKKIGRIVPASEKELEQGVDEIRANRESEPTLRKKGEWCVAYEEIIGGRPPAKNTGQRPPHRKPDE